LSLGKGLLALVEPAIREFCPGIVDPEQVPADRLAGGQSAEGPPTSGWNARC
jgi:hypothetical protein